MPDHKYWIYHWKVTATAKTFDLQDMLAWFEKEVESRLDPHRCFIGVLSLAKRVAVLETRHVIGGDYDSLPLEIKSAAYVAKRK